MSIVISIVTCGRPRRVVRPQCQQPALMLPVAELVEQRDLHSPDGLVYSTSPKAGRCRDGHQYVLKGALDIEVVKAEAAAHILASHLAIPTPCWKLISAPKICNHLLFGSEIVQHGFRDVSSWLRRNAVINREAIPTITGFDIWLANPDRNLGNLIGRTSEDGQNSQLEILAIDFEKAYTLRGVAPSVVSASEPTRSMMPQGELGDILKELTRPSSAWLNRLIEIPERTISNALRPVQQQLNLTHDWHTMTAKLLKRRAAKMPEMIEEVWQ